MTEEIDADELSEALLESVRVLVRAARAVQSDTGLTAPERSALAQLERGGPTSSAELARREQIRPQSMGSTLSSLESRGLVVRRPDPEDGRRVLLSVTASGRNLLRRRRGARTQRVGAALSESFTEVERRRLAAAAPLIERLAREL